MASLNKVMIIGNLGNDPDSRYLPNGDAVCNISVATSETWKDKTSGEKKESVEWHRVVFFRQLAEIASKYLRKGYQVFVEGSIKTKKWQDKDGNDRYTTEIVGHEMKMLGSKDGGGGSSGGGGGKPAPYNERDRAPSQSAAAQQAPKSKTPSFDDMDDDIPF